MRHLPRQLVGLFTAALLVVVAAEPGSAQGSRDGTPTDGDWSLMFTIFEEDALTHFGIFRMTGDRLNLGLEAEFEWADGEQRARQPGVPTVRAEGTSWDLLIGPSVRWYGNRLGPVSPYLRSRLAVGWGASELFINGDRRNRSDSFVLQASLGIGAEWYPIRWLGVGGHTGLVFTRTDTEDVTDQSENRVDGVSYNVRTFRSGLVGNFYFR